MRKMKWMCGVAAVCLLALPCALATVQAQGLSDADAGFLKAAAASGSFEVEAAKLAVQRADSSKVKDYASKMLEQHREIGAELKTLAANKKVRLPDQLDQSDLRTLAQLQQREGPAFDLVYIDKAAVEGHIKINQLFEAAVYRATDPEVRDFAQRVLPIVTEHLAMSRALQQAPPVDADKILPPVKGEAPAVSPASREAPASIAPDSVAPAK